MSIYINSGSDSKCDVYTDATYVFFPDLVQLSGNMEKLHQQNIVLYY